MKKVIVKKPALRLLVLAFTVTSVLAADEPQYNFKPPAGYVPDAKTAIRIAVAIWEPIYGAGRIASERPYRAILRNGVWTVEGSLPKNWEGGVALAEVSKDDGRILRVSHGK